MPRLLISVLTLAVLWLAPQPAGEYPIQAAPLTSVTLTDNFWKPRLDRNRSSTLPDIFQQNENSGRIDNFLKAAKQKPGAHTGELRDDAVVYQSLEAASYSLAVHADPVLDKKVDELIASVAAAQERDGYLYTARSMNPANSPKGAGLDRWSSLSTSYELYDMGRMIEAAVAHNLATGKRNFLDVALKAANLITNVFGPEKRRDVAAHPGIELALVRLSRLTGDGKYLRTAKFLVDERLKSQSVESPLAAMTDIAVFTDDRAAAKSLDGVFDTLAAKRLPVTGETDPCAVVDGILWYHRMFLRTADVRYLDVLEKSLFNGFLAGVSAPADKASCPADLARLMAQLPALMYAQSKEDIYVTQFASSTAKLTFEGMPLTITQSTDYPWQGRVQLRIDPAKPIETTLSIRVPGWVRGEAMPNDAYRYASVGEQSGMVTLNGKPFNAVETDGFLQVHRLWRAGDTLALEFPMPVQRVLAHDGVAAYRGKSAIQRGPVMYAAETATGVKLPLSARLTATFDKSQLGGLMIIRGPGMTALPYFAASSRAGETTVWLPQQ